MNYQTTQYGFDWGNAKIKRLFSDEKKGWVIFSLETDKYTDYKAIQIYVTKTGKVRVHSKDGEWLPKGKKK